MLLLAIFNFTQKYNKNSKLKKYKRKIIKIYPKKMNLKNKFVQSLHLVSFSLCIFSSFFHAFVPIRKQVWMLIGESFVNCVTSWTWFNIYCIYPLCNPFISHRKIFAKKLNCRETEAETDRMANNSITRYGDLHRGRCKKIVLWNACMCLGER